MNLKLYTLDSSGAKLRLSLVKDCCVTHTHSISIKVIAGSVKANAVGLNGGVYEK